MKKRSLSFIGILLTALCILFCSSAETVIDHAGREVQIIDNPTRIVSGYYISTSAILALQLKDKLVGIEAKAAQRSLYKMYAPELTSLSSVGSVKQFDIEACAALEPDLVILPLKLSSIAETLEILGIPVLLVNPEDQTSLKEMIELIGKAAGKEERAQLLLAAMKTLEEDLRTILENTRHPRVYIAANSAFLSTAGYKMYQSDLITLAGGTNVAAKLEGAYWQTISYEQLLAWNPEYIILPSDASYSVRDVLDDNNLAELAAIKQGHVLQMPGDIEAWDSPVPGSLLGAWWLASQLHNDFVTEDEFNARVKAYYDTFYQDR